MIFNLRVSKSFTLCLFGALLGASSAFATAKENCDPRNDSSRKLASDAQPIEVAAGPSVDQRKLMKDISSDPAVETAIGKLAPEDLNSVQLFTCGDATSNAVLTCDGKTIVTNAHSIINESGQLRWEGDQNKGCYFTTLGKDGYTFYEVETFKREEAESRVGTMYPYGNFSKGTDWAVLRLKEKIPSKTIKPAQIMSTNTSYDLANSTCVTGSAFAGSQFVDENNPGIGIRMYSVCENKGLRTERGKSAYVTNCKVDHGASASGRYCAKEGKPVLTALLAEHFSQGQETDVKSDGSYAVPIREEFLEAIKANTSNKKCIESFSPPPQQAEGRSKKDSLPL